MIASAIRRTKALTLYDLLAETAPDAPPLSLLRCYLKTVARTRSASISRHGLPLVGDALYSEPRHRGIADPALARSAA